MARGRKGKSRTRKGKEQKEIRAAETPQVQVPLQSPITAEEGNGTAAAAAAAGAASSRTIQDVLLSLYVGGLEDSVTDCQLYELFSEVGLVISVRVCRDFTTHRSLGYGYVNFCSQQDAARALNELNFTSLNGKPIRIMYAVRDPSIRKNGDANIFIKNLDKAMNDKALHDTFSVFGNILSCQIAKDASGQSKGYGFVQFLEEEAAKDAIDKLNGKLINDNKVYVGPFQSKLEREASARKTTMFNNVFVKNLSDSTTDDFLKGVFGMYGTITSAVVMREVDGKSKCFGFVNFGNADAAAKSIEALNGKKFDGKEWYVGKAQKKAERELELKRLFDQNMKESADKYEDRKLYVNNLDASIDDDILRDMLSRFGKITSCKVMIGPNGVSKGAGFVVFSTTEEAFRAIAEMHGKTVVGKCLYVAFAKRKDRTAMLQVQFSQTQPVSMAPSVAQHDPLYSQGPPALIPLQAQFSQTRPVSLAPSVAECNPFYPPHAPHLGGQIFYGQDPPALIPPQQQLVPRMRLGGASLPNSFIPFVPQSQHALHSGGRHTDAGPVQHTQLSMPAVQQQMFPWGLFYGYPPGGCNIPVPGVTGGMLPTPYDMSGMQMRDAGISQPIPIRALASALD